MNQQKIPLPAQPKIVWVWSKQECKKKKDGRTCYGKESRIVKAESGHEYCPCDCCKHGFLVDRSVVPC